MAIIKCNRGHYFDDTKYEMCPICRDEGIDTDELGLPLTPVFDYDETVTLDLELETETSDLDKTIGIKDCRTNQKLLTGWLVAMAGPMKGRDFRLYRGWNKIGRGMDMDVYLSEDKHISREGNGSIVYDEKHRDFYFVANSNGLAYLNGTLAEGVLPLTEGDVITVGDSDLVFVPFCTEERTW